MTAQTQAEHAVLSQLYDLVAQCVWKCATSHCPDVARSYTHFCGGSLLNLHNGTSSLPQM